MDIVLVLNLPLVGLRVVVAPVAVVAAAVVTTEIQKF